MTIADWPYYISKATGWLNPLLHLVGIIVCIAAYRVSRKVGYLIVATYCFLATCGLMFGPAINQMIRERWHPPDALSPAVEQEYQQKLSALNERYYGGREPRTDLPAEEHQRYVEEFVKLNEHYYPAGPPGIATTLDYEFPIGPMILILGIWVLARQESKKITGADAPAAG